MSVTFPENPKIDDTWENPETNEKFVWDNNNWTPLSQVLVAGGDMTGTLVVPDTRINGGLLSVDTNATSIDPPDDGELAGWGNWDKWSFVSELETPLDKNSNKIDLSGRSVLYIDGRLIFTERDKVYWTDDFKTMNLSTKNTSGHDGGSLRALAYSPELDIIVCGGMKSYHVNGANRMWYSTDRGETWTRTPTNIARADLVPLWIPAPHSMFIASGYDWDQSKPYWKSTDGKNWTYFGSRSDNVQDLVWASEQNRWIAATQYRYQIHYSGVGNPTSYSTKSSGEKNNPRRFATSYSPLVGKILFGRNADNSFIVDASSIARTVLSFKSHTTLWVPQTSQFLSALNGDLKVSSDGTNWIDYPSAIPGKYLRRLFSDQDQTRIMVQTEDIGTKKMEIYEMKFVDNFANSTLLWNEEPVRLDVQNSAVSLSRSVSGVASRSGEVELIQDSVPLNTETVYYTPDSYEVIDLQPEEDNYINQGELWYQPSTNTLHVRDSDEWVSLFQ